MEKTILGVSLTLTKSIANLIYNGCIESSNKSVHNTFRKALDDVLDNQEELFGLMENKGYYNIKNTNDSNINEVKNKYKQK